MDWIRKGWGPDFSQIFDSKKNYYLELTNLNPHSKPLLDISNRVIEQISQEYPSPYTLMASGGVDSQTMIWCWHKSNVPFNVVCVELVDQHGTIYNEHDISTLRLFSELLHIKVDFIKFDIFDFLENRLHDYAIPYQCTSPQITAHMAMSELVNEGTKIFSGNFIPGGLYDYTILGLERYAKTSGHSVIPFFLSYDCELAAALIQYDSKCDLRQPIPYEKKVALLQSAKVPVIPQETKLTGFEKIKDVCDIKYRSVVTIKDKIKYHTMPSKRTFDILFRYRLTDQIRYQDKLVFIFPDWNPLKKS